MMLVDRKKESKQCSSCKLDYNKEDRMPKCFIPCGHTWCNICMSSFKEKNPDEPKCPECKERITQYIPDHEMTDMIAIAAKTSEQPKKIEDKPKPKLLNKNIKSKMIKFMMQDE